MEGISLSEQERSASKVMLLDSRFRIIASTEPDTWGHSLHDGKIVAYGLTPGYETYRGLGWFGCIESSEGLAG